MTSLSGLLEGKSQQRKTTIVRGCLERVGTRDARSKMMGTMGYQGQRCCRGRANLWRKAQVCTTPTGDLPLFKQLLKVQDEALLLYKRLCDWIDRLQLPDTDIVGPASALMERVGGKCRWQMIARGPDLHRLIRVIDAPGWEIAIDPVSSLLRDG